MNEYTEEPCSACLMFGDHAPDCEAYPCEHEGHVVKGTCERCGATGLESDAETYEKEAPR